MRNVGIGFIISLVVMAVFLFVIMIIIFPFDRKYIVRENRKINYKKSTVYLRWNVFDTLTLVVALYTIVCVQVLNIFISSGETIENPFVQFLTNQSQAWVIVTVVYLVTRLSLTLKSIKAHFGDLQNEEQ